MVLVKQIEQQCQARTNVRGLVGEWHPISATVYENRMRAPRQGYEVRIEFVVVAVVSVTIEEPMQSAWPKSFYETGKYDEGGDDAADVFHWKPTGE